MDSSTPTTDKLDSAHVSTPEDATTETHIAPLSISRERCSGCGATLASDQRYCVECGQRCGAPRLPFTEGLVDRAQETPSSRSPAGRARISINSTVIAGVGTLLLAMGIGVLIGRSGTGGSVKSASPAVQVVTVPGAGGAAVASSAESQTSTNAAGSTKSKGSSSAASTAKSTGQASKKVPVSPAKTVTVGSPGKGPGYQKGHFTGNFFGE